MEQMVSISTEQKEKFAVSVTDEEDDATHTQNKTIDKEVPEDRHKCEGNNHFESNLDASLARSTPHISAEADGTQNADADATSVSSRYNCVMCDSHFVDLNQLENHVKGHNEVLHFSILLKKVASISSDFVSIWRKLEGS